MTCRNNSLQWNQLLHEDAMHLTWLDSNSWLIEMSGKRVLLDPWLVGPLVFGNMNWLFKGARPSPRPIPDSIDLILLSQGLEDHAHPGTLQQLDRQIPVVASPSAAKVVQSLGYTQVTTLEHGETTTVESLEIRATPGSPIGPLLTENGYLLKDLTAGTKLYYEPHGYHSPSIKEFAPVDVVITPVVTLEVPLLGPVIQGKKTILEVVQWLQPKVLLPTAAGGDVQFEGVLQSLLRASGSVEELRSLLTQHQLSTQVVDLQPGERYEPLAIAV